MMVPVMQGAAPQVPQGPQQQPQQGVPVRQQPFSKERQFCAALVAAAAARRKECQFSAALQQDPRMAAEGDGCVGTHMAVEDPCMVTDRNGCGGMVRQASTGATTPGTADDFMMAGGRMSRQCTASSFISAPGNQQDPPFSMSNDPLSRQTSGCVMSQGESWQTAEESPRPWASDGQLSECTEPGLECQSEDDDCVPRRLEVKNTFLTIVDDAPASAATGRALSCPAVLRHR
jgi:hypothetical protein